MDLTRTTIGLDVWEGSLDIDEQVLRDAGVEFLIVRANDMNGGHKKDKGFDKQWAEGRDFIRWPYFVYNPWVNGQKNYDFQKTVLPAGVNVVSPDIEVKYPGYSATTYAKEFEKYIGLMKANLLKPVIYTGGWFASYLAYWPAGEDYWWARYPFALYPEKTENITWEVLKEKLKAVAWYPAAPGTIPGPCRLWQCSGDRYKLPGTVARAVDINVFNGTPQDMIAHYGFREVHIPERLRKPQPPTPEPTPPTFEERLRRVEEALKRMGAL